MNERDVVSVRVSHRFSASAERVFDAWLDPERACKFLFVTPSGQMVRTEVDARVGGRYTIVERRGGEDVEHTGTYLEIDRPRRLVFTLAVPKYSPKTDRIQIDIAALESGCELTLTHEMNAKFAEQRERAESGWRGILERLAEQIAVDEPATCGAGLAEQARLLAKLVPYFGALADTLEAHRRALVPSDEQCRHEDAAYASLATGWRNVAERVGRVTAEMASYHDLPMGDHDESAFGPQLEAFRRLVAAQNELLGLWRAAAERDQAMLGS